VSQLGQWREKGERGRKGDATDLLHHRFTLEPLRLRLCKFRFEGRRSVKFPLEVESLSGDLRMWKNKKNKRRPVSQRKLDSRIAESLRKPTFFN